MNKKQAQSEIKNAIENVEAYIARSTNRDSKFSTGLAYEGYNGGYLAALMDVEMLLNGWKPDRNGRWNKQEANR